MVVGSDPEEGTGVSNPGGDGILSPDAGDTGRSGRSKPWAGPRRSLLAAAASKGEGMGLGARGLGRKA